MTLFTIFLIVIVILAVFGLGWSQFSTGVLTGLNKALDVGIPIIKNLTQEAQEANAQSQNVNESENTTQIIAQMIPEFESVCKIPQIVSACVNIAYEGPTRIILTGEYSLGGGFAGGENMPGDFNTAIWKVVETLETRGFSVELIELTGQGSVGNPHSYFIILSNTGINESKEAIRNITQQSESESESPQTIMEAAIEGATNTNATGKNLQCILDYEDAQEELECMRQ